jgi:hypothetical protein
MILKFENEWNRNIQTKYFAHIAFTHGHQSNKQVDFLPIEPLTEGV